MIGEEGRGTGKKRNQSVSLVSTPTELSHTEMTIPAHNGRKIIAGAL